jgi:5-hydroxyisourate hydrolase-like protein (transthyretin family)
MNQKNSILFQNLFSCLALVLFAAGCAGMSPAEMTVQFKVVDANTKAPMAGVQSHSYEIGRSAAARISEINPQPMPPTDASGMTSAKGTPGGYGFRFQQDGYFDARAILHSADSMDVVTYEVENGVQTGNPAHLNSHNRHFDPKDVVTIELYPKK